MAERFWAKVKIKGLDECWLWTGATAKGYGQISRGTRKEPCVGAHVVSWELARKRKVPYGKEIAHLCNIPRCVNPRHLRLKTHKANMIDANKDGLIPPRKKGELATTAKISEIQARLIKAANKYGEVKQLCIKFGISPFTGYQIRKGRTWTHLR